MLIRLMSTREADICHMARNLLRAFPVTIRFVNYFGISILLQSNECKEGSLPMNTHSTIHFSRVFAGNPPLSESRCSHRGNKQVTSLKIPPVKPVLFTHRSLPPSFPAVFLGMIEQLPLLGFSSGSSTLNSDTKIECSLKEPG